MQRKMMVSLMMIVALWLTLRRRPSLPKIFTPLLVFSYAIVGVFTNNKPCDEYYSRWSEDTTMAAIVAENFYILHGNQQ